MIVQPTKIWIVQKKTAKLEVHPPVVILTPGEKFTVGNRSPFTLLVDFGGKIKPSGGEIPPGTKSGTFEVNPSEGAYFEYDITVPVEGYYVEGGSKPGAIIDP